MLGINLDKIGGHVGHADLCKAVTEVQKRTKDIVESTFTVAAGIVPDPERIEELRPYAAVGLSEEIMLEHCLPFIVADAFDQIDDNILSGAGMVGGIYVAHAKVLDAIFDKELHESYQNSAMILSLLLYDRTLEEILTLLPPLKSKRALEAFFRYHPCQFRALMAQSFEGKLPSFQDYRQIAQDAAEGRKIIIDLLALAGKPRGDYNLLYSSLDSLAVANQLIDDFMDWEEDFERNTRTYFLYQASIQLQGKITSAGNIASVALRKSFMKDYFTRVLENYDEAASLATRAGSTCLAEAINQIATQVLTLTEIALKECSQ